VCIPSVGHVYSITEVAQRFRNKSLRELYGIFIVRLQKLL